MIKILIIDDEKIIRERLNKILELDGFFTFVASNAMEGIRIFNKEKPEICLVDLKMPGMDGVAVLEKIMESKIKTEVIIFSGDESVESAVEAKKKGAFDYLLKPIDLNILEATIKKAIKKIKK